MVCLVLKSYDMIIDKVLKLIPNAGNLGFLVDHSIYSTSKIGLSQ